MVHRHDLVSHLLACVLVLLAACQRDGTRPELPPMKAPVTAPHGTWASPLGAERLAAASIAMGDVQVRDGVVYWRESRPAQGGRQTLMRLGRDGAVVEVTPDGSDIRTRVHEYGGAAYLPLANGFVHSAAAGQQLVRRLADGTQRVLTPAQYRYADCVADPVRPRLLCVREDHTVATKDANGEERNEIVALDPDATTPDPGRVLVTGSDFVAYPRPSPDGRHLAWIAWDHPHMPWDQARLHVATLGDDGIDDVRLVAGGPGRAPTEPQWAADGSLYFIDDPDGWWNLYRWRDGVVSAVAPMAREFGGPLWTHGASSYVLAGPDFAVVRSSRDGIDRLGHLDLRSGELRDFELPFVAFDQVRLLDAGTAVALAASVDEEAALIAVDLADGRHRVLHRPVAAPLPRDHVSRAEPIRYPTAPGPDGQPRDAHAFFYPPTNPGFRAPDGERPPLLVMVHGGPTSVARPALALNRQFWTSRGFAVADVNYGGSTTFGRAYRERLNGQWGVVDVADVLAVVEALVAAGRVDGARVAIRGGSAGGFTVLAALAFGDRFRAGANYYGVADIKALAATSHKFERHYDSVLVGPPDDALYRARSPLFHLDGFNEPLITFQGSDDRVVPPEQSRMIVAALRARGVPVAYLEFAGEQHGFRRAESIIQAHQAELAFYGRVFGFVPADALPPLAIDNLPPP